MGFVAEKIFLTKGVGKAREKLTSFELALRDAGIAQYNLVRVSSILPPNCKIVTRQQGEKYLQPGEVIHVVLAQCETNEPNRLISASIGVAVPRDSNQYGYLSEHHAYGVTGEKAGDYAEDLAAQMLATTLGVPFDADSSWDEKKQQYKLGGRIVLTRNITQSAEGDKDGLWTTVVAAAVMIGEWS